jgi:asparagine synthase (glutamine-hydrolysing)
VSTPADDPLLELVAMPDGVRATGAASLRVGQKVDRPEDRRDAVFAEWRWDGERLELQNDRYGFYPLFYSDTGNVFRLSTSIPRLISAGAPRELDEAAFSVFLRLGFLVGEDTPFRAIRALPPGARLVWRPGRLELKHELPRRPRLTLGRDEAVERYVGLFRSAMRRRMPKAGRVVVPLSGGQDSRHILLELMEGGCAPRCVTARYYPPRGTPDAEVAVQITKALGLEHRILDQPTSQLETTMRHHVATNFCTLTPSSFLLSVGDFLRAEADVVYDGIGGDVMSAGLFLNPARVRRFGEGRLEELADDLLATFNGGAGFDRMLTQALRPRSGKRFSRGLAVKRLARELERHTEMANPLSSFCFFNRTRRDMALLPFRAYAGVPTVHCPYLDGSLYDFLSSLPAELLLDHSFHADTIARAFPRFAGLPYAGWESASGRQPRRQYRRFTRELMRYCGPGGHAALLRPSWVLPRLARALVDPSYGVWAAWAGPLIVYVNQLEVLVGTGFLA